MKKDTISLRVYARIKEQYENLNLRQRKHVITKTLWQLETNIREELTK